jgi:sulfite reductase (NADPH) flavoprotein alpha-component
MTSDPSAAVRVRFAREAQGVRRSSVYIDPYDGRILGSPAGEETFATIRRLHRWLLLPGDGDGYGRWVTGAAIISLLALLMTGIVLRWPRKVRNLSVWLKPNFVLHGRGFFWSLHSVVGTWLIPIYLVTILTGLWWSYDWYKDAATWLLTGKERPVAGQKMAKGAAPEAGKGAKAARAPQADRAASSLDLAWSAFRERFGATYAVATLILPSGASTVIRVRSVSKDAPGEAARDEIRIDGVTGRIVSAELYTDKTAGETIIARVLDIHTGSMFGLIGRIVFMLAAALMPLFMVTGYLLYLSRRRLRAAVLAASRLQDHPSQAAKPVHGSVP